MEEEITNNLSVDKKKAEEWIHWFFYQKYTWNKGKEISIKSFDVM
jgi:hypothetical protein